MRRGGENCGTLLYSIECKEVDSARGSLEKVEAEDIAK